MTCTVNGQPEVASPRRATRVPVLALCLLLSFAGWGEIEKQATTSDTGFNLFWWPKLPTLEGWAQDREASLGYGVNALAPKGKRFRDAETVMYAKAIYKPQAPECKSVDDLVKHDTEHFKQEQPSLKVKQLPDIADGDGKKLKVYEFTPEKEGNWEAVAYGAEGDYFLIFTISSRKASGYKAEFPTFVKLVGKYKENPAPEKKESPPPAAAQKP